MMVVCDEWWVSGDQGGFFGAHYMLGDDSKLGPYLRRSMSLRERTEREVAFIMGALGLKAGNTLLDCPCGYGRHSIALAQRGIKVTGVDLNDRYLSLARQEMQRSKLNHNRLQFLKGDMRELPLDSDQFDVAINMFTSFGFFKTVEEDLQVLKEFCRLLKAGGRLLIHLDYNYERRIRGMRDERVTRHLRDGSTLFVNERLDRQSGTISGRWDIVQKNKKQIYSRSYTLRMFDHETFKRLLEASGFTHVSFKGDLDNWDVPLSTESVETAVIAIK